MTKNRVIRVLIADDFKLLREVIRLFLERSDDMEVIDEAPDLYDALASAKALQPDVIILNDYLPPIDCAYAAALFREQGYTGSILAVSMLPERDLIQRSFTSGINGFMHKDEIDDYLLDAIRHIHNGEQYLSPKAKEAHGPTQK